MTKEPNYHYSTRELVAITQAVMLDQLRSLGTEGQDETRQWSRIGRVLDLQEKLQQAQRRATIAQKELELAQGNALLNLMKMGVV